MQKHSTMLNVKPKVHYKETYYQAIDSPIATINNHSNQPDYDICAKLEQMLVLAIRNGNYYSELKEVTEFYKDNFNKSEIEIQLEVFGQMKIDYVEDNM